MYQPPAWVLFISVPPFRIPAQLQTRYQMIERLGVGVSGMVFRARQVSLERDVVVKLVQAPDPESQIVVRALQEASLLAELHHPRVVSLLDHGVIDEVLYLVYPDDGGRALSLHKELYPCEPDRTTQLLSDVLEGLGALHEIGAVHRDVKPANILLLPDGSAMLIDLGLAKDLEGELELTMTGAAVGTPHYMAPGQIDLVDADERDDLYAAGVVAYELLVGTNPFRSENIYVVVDRHLHLVPDAPHELTDCPAGLSRLVMGLLEKDREDRIQSAGQALEMLHGLTPKSTETREITRKEKTHPTMAVPIPPSFPQRPTREIRKRSLRSGMVFGGIAAAALLALGVLILRRPPAEAPTPSPSLSSSEWPAGLPRDFGASLRTAYRKVPPLDPDPFNRGKQLSARSELEPFFRWLRDGGKPELLTEENRRVLDEVDAAFLEKQAAPPFSAFLRVRPHPGAGPPSKELLGASRYGGYMAPSELLDSTLGPWSGAAGILIGKVIEHTNHDDLRRLEISEKASGLQGVDILGTVQELDYAIAEKRIRHESRRRVENRLMESLFYALSRAARDGESHAVMTISASIGTMAFRNFMASFSFLEPEQLMASDLKLQSERVLGLQFLSATITLRRKILRDFSRQKVRMGQWVKEFRSLTATDPASIFFHYQAEGFHIGWVKYLDWEGRGKLWADRHRITRDFPPILRARYISHIGRSFARFTPDSIPKKIAAELAREVAQAKEFIENQTRERR